MVLGMSQSEADDFGPRGTNEGSKLAGNADLWYSGDLENNSEFGTSGFNGLPAGYIASSYNYIGTYGHFWSSTEANSNHAWSRKLPYNHTYVRRDYIGKGVGHSIRCLRD